MMMPANFSVIAENELTYVVGGSAITDAVKTFNTNMVTIVGNTYVSKLIGTTLGTLFSGSWGENNSLLDNMADTFFPDKMNGFNKVLSAVGLGAAVYQLGTTTAATEVSSKRKTEDKIDGLTEHGWENKKWRTYLGKFGRTPDSWLFL